MILFISSYMTVFLLVFQQQNVANRKFIWATTTSIAITVSQFVLVKAITGSDPLDVTFMAAGGVIGVLSSMYLHPIITGLYRKPDSRL